MHETIIYIYLFIYIQLPYCHFRPDKILFTLRCILIFVFISVSELSKKSWNQQHFALVFPKYKARKRRRSKPSQLRENISPVSIEKVI